MLSVIRVSFAVVTLVTAFLLGRLSYKSHVTEYLELDLLDKHKRVDQLTSCQLELRESVETYNLLDNELNTLRTCMSEYSLLFDTTKFNQKYSIDEVQRIRECL